MDPILGLYTTTLSTGGVLSVLTHLRASTITVSNYNNYYMVFHCGHSTYTKYIWKAIKKSATAGDFSQLREGAVFRNLNFLSKFAKTFALELSENETKHKMHICFSNEPLVR